MSNFTSNMSVLLECNTDNTFPPVRSDMKKCVYSAHVDIHSVLFFCVPVDILAENYVLSRAYIFTLTKRQKILFLQPNTHTHRVHSLTGTTTLPPLSCSLYLHPPIHTSLSLFFSLPLWWQDGQWAVRLGRGEDAAAHINNAEPQLPPSAAAMALAHRCHQGGAGNILSLFRALLLSVSLT